MIDSNNKPKSLTAFAIALIFSSCFTAAPSNAQGIDPVRQALMIQQAMSGNNNRTNARGLPHTQLDSFVYQAGPMAEQIYGGDNSGLFPYFGFSKGHRIDAGIAGQRRAGLTTGHGSFLPDAWGADEILAPPGEWSTTGSNSGPSISATNLDAYQLGLMATSPVLQALNGNNQPNVTTNVSGSQLPPPPGEGYEPAYVHGVFQGYYSPQEVALSQTDFPAAFESFVYSGRYLGSMENAQYILEVEMGRPQGGRLGN